MCLSDFDILRISFRCHLLQLAPSWLQAGSKLAAAGYRLAAAGPSLAAAGSRLAAGSLQAGSQLISRWLRVARMAPRGPPPKNGERSVRFRDGKEMAGAPLVWTV